MDRGETVPLKKGIHSNKIKITEVITMKDTRDTVRQHDHRGICSGCDHVAACGLHSEDEKPVFFCEEFSLQFK